MNLFEAVFAHDLAAPAIRFGGREISYGELRSETLQMALAITSLGVQRGDRVALLLHDSPAFVAAFIATCSLGAIAVPINMALRWMSSVQSFTTVVQQSRWPSPIYAALCRHMRRKDCAR